MIQSVLARCDASMVHAEPYPHVTLHNALPDELYDALSAEYPLMERIVDGRDLGSNLVLFKKALHIANEDWVTPLWRAFVEYHTSAIFYADVLRIFGAHIRSIYPEQEWSGLKTGIRGYNHEADIHLDAQFGINTPVIGRPSSVRGRHVDQPKKLYNGLLYCRHPEDKAGGGEFVIYHRDIEYARVPYQGNTLVFFVNTPRSAHGVALREAGPYPRRYMSFTGETNNALFKRE